VGLENTVDLSVSQIFGDANQNTLTAGLMYLFDIRTAE